MKNKLQQMAVTTLFFIVFFFFFYWVFGSLIILGIFIELVTIFVSSYLIFFDQRNATAKFAWLLAMLMLPYIGLVLFFLIGRNQQKRRFHQVQVENIQALNRFFNERLAQQEEWFDRENNETNALYQLSKSRILEKNTLEPLHDGEAAYQRILNDIRQAKHHIHLFYFIFKADETGTKLTQLLREKVAEGVAVRFMYDSVGSIKLPFAWLNQLKVAGIEVRPYDLVNSPLLSTRLNWRNHRKIVVVDGKVAHLGGMNIGNEYRSMTEKFSYWRDTNLRIQGPAVWEVQKIFVHDWIFFEKEEAVTFFSKDAESYFPRKSFKEESNEACQILFGGPYDRERIIHDSFMSLIGKATKSIKIVSPYLVPDEESLASLRRASRSGVTVQIIIPGKGDRALSYFGNTSFIDSLLEAGIEVYLYDKEAFLHAKYLIIDDVVATIGSTNFDIRSFYLNHEISAFLYGPSATIDKMVVQFEKDCLNSIIMTKEQRARRPVTQRIKERLSAFFAPLL
ncbi:cardiolipin synthase [Enterococcus sp. LJL98]